MFGKQAKVLDGEHIEALLLYARLARHPARNEAMVLLSIKAGLRAAEIANLTWEMVLRPDGQVGTGIELHAAAAKNRSGRRIPMHPDLRQAILQLEPSVVPTDPVIRSERGPAMRPVSIVHWFARAYRGIGLQGCSSHSGRRTFITRAARAVHHAGGSLRDVQLLAGHRSIQTTQAYIDGDTDAQRRLVQML